MDFFSAAADIIRDLLIFVGAMVALLVALIIIVANLRDSPLKRVLYATSFRVAATLLAGVVAVPIEPIPGLDAIYDVGAPLLVLIYWISLFARAGRILRGTASSSLGRIIEHDPPAGRPRWR